MAGNAKPQVPLLGPEAIYTRLNGFSANNQDGQGLFDGTTVDGWDTNSVFYWNAVTSYVEINILSSLVHIWRSGVSSYPANKGSLKIKKWDGSAYVDVTSTFPQTLSNLTNLAWERTIENLPMGQYRFEYGSGARIDSEWFIEDVSPPTPPSGDLGKSIFKISSGLLFSDDYNSVSSRWVLSPAGSYTITEKPGFMRMKHHASNDTLMLTDIPKVSQFAFEVHADFAPIADGDNGGLIIWKNSSSKTEFLEKVDALTQENQKSWMAVKDDNNWVFYSDEGMGYNFIDSEYIDDATRFGVVLKRGSQPDFTNLDVDRMIATLGDKIVVRNVASGYKVSIEDKLGNTLVEDVVQDSTGAILKMPRLEIDGILKIKDENDVEVTQVPTILYGGDVYSLGTSIEVRYQGNELSTTTQTDLGSLTTGKIEIPLEVFNPSTFDAANVKIAIEQYLSKFGWTWAEVAPDVSGVPGVYSQSLDILLLQSITPYPFWLRITKGTNYMGMEPLQFNIHMEHD